MLIVPESLAMQLGVPLFYKLLRLLYTLFGRICRSASSKKSSQIPFNSSPCRKAGTEGGGHEFGVGGDADTGEVEAVGIEADVDGDVARAMFHGVEFAGLFQEGNLMVGE